MISPLSCQHLTQRYGGVLACEGVDVSFQPGEIHALLGENGAGKSTLIRMLSGVERPQAGKIEVDGRVVVLRSADHARALGIATVHQGGAFIPTMSVGDNLRLVGASQDAPGMLAGLDTNARLEVVDVGARRLLELRASLAGSPRVVILDEPTALLSTSEAAGLFAALRELARSGVAVVVVSHKMPEILEHADSMTVLRAGRAVARLRRDEVSAERVSLALFGSAAQVRPADPRPSGSDLVHLCDLRLQGADGEALNGVSLTVRRGEVLWVAGRRGSGAASVERLLVERRRAPGIRWEEKSQGVRVGWVPRDARQVAGVAEMSTGENLALRHRNRLSWRPRWWRGGSAMRADSAVLERFDVRPGDPAVAFGSLSGGNAQKVVLAREIAYGQDLLVASNPTSGLDFRAADRIREELGRHASSGAAVVVVSDDLDEMVGVADRAVVLARGRVSAILERPEIDRAAVGGAL